jgi:hypothetical protein
VECKLAASLIRPRCGWPNRRTQLRPGAILTRSVILVPTFSAVTSRKFGGNTRGARGGVGAGSSVLDQRSREAGEARRLRTR